MESTILLVLVVALVLAVGGYWWFFMRKGAGSTGKDMMGGSDSTSMGGSDGMNPPSANLTMDTEGMDMGGEVTETPMEETPVESAPVMPETPSQESSMGMDEAGAEETLDLPAEGEDNMPGGDEEEPKTA